MFIDTHCHLNFKDFKDDYNQVAQRALDNQVEMIVVGSEFKTSQRAVGLLDEFKEGVYAAVGLHPIHLQDVVVRNNNENGKYEFRSRKEVYSEKIYMDLLRSNKRVVAIGETGLDYFHINTDSDLELKKIKSVQQEVFYKQLELARKVNLPVIIHCREAHKDLLSILQEFHRNNNFKEEWGVIHCFSGDYDLAKKYFEIGLKISFTGLITFVKDWEDTIKKSPLQKIMIETDSPYLTPVPHRGERNEPVYVKEVAKKIASIKNLNLSIVEDQLYKESKIFFNL